MSGATTVAAGIYYDGSQEPGGSASSNYGIGLTVPVLGLTPGSNTFKAKYKVSAGTGTFFDRRISVIPL